MGFLVLVTTHGARPVLPVCEARKHRVRPPGPIYSPSPPPLIRNSLPSTGRCAARSISGAVIYRPPRHGASPRRGRGSKPRETSCPGSSAPPLRASSKPAVWMGTVRDKKFEVKVSIFQVEIPPNGVEFPVNRVEISQSEFFLFFFWCSKRRKAVGEGKGSTSIGGGEGGAGSRHVSIRSASAGLYSGG